MLEQYIYRQVSEHKLSPADAKALLKELAARGEPRDDIAIVGLSCRFPGADDAREYWTNLVEGRCSIDYFPEQRARDVEHVWTNPAYMEFLVGTPYKGSRDTQAMFEKNGYLRECDCFDAEFFGISPREATFMDPMQRKFLETAWEAMEDAGYGGKSLVSTRTGVFAGRLTDVVLYRYMSSPDPLLLTGSWEGILASRVSYLFDFRGPAMVVDTACSSGLVAVHLACQALRNKECEVAIAGGICIGFGALKQDRGPMDMKAVEATDGRVRAFDDGASGTVWGEGVGVVVLKSLKKALADGDHIHAIIKGSGVNNDGTSNGITAPNAAAQEELLTQVWRDAQIDPRTISYVETHGTGTALGDPIEVRGLANAFARHTSQRQFCGIGSVKTNIGHTVGASGMASLLKVVLAMKHGVLPATLHFERPNRHINFTDSPVYVNDTLREWETPNGDPRRAGVSAFGFSGTNAHLVLEQAPVSARTRVEPDGPFMLPLAAKSEAALLRLVERYIDFFTRENAALIDVCYTAAVGRGHASHRLALVGDDVTELRAALVRVRDEGLTCGAGAYGVHRVVNERKALRAASDLTSSELERLSSEAGALLASLPAAGVRREALSALAALYARGANVDFDSLYASKRPQRVSIPTYPFERKRLWADKKPAEAGLPLGEALGHPLLERKVCELPELEVYATTFAPERYWVLADHRVCGVPVLPGTALLELGCELGKRHFPDAPLELVDVMFLAPFEVPERSERELFALVKPGPELHVRFASRNEADSSAWVDHATMRVRPSADAASPAPSISVAQLGERQAAPPTNTAELSLSGRWENGRVIAASELAAVAELGLASEHAADLDGLTLHPALLDNAVNIAGFSLKAPAGASEAKSMFLPLGYRKVRVLRKMPARLRSELRLVGTPSPEAQTLTADLILSDVDGRVCLQIEGYTLKRFAVETLRRKPAATYAIAYREDARPALESGESLGEVALVAGRGPRAEGVRQWLAARAAGVLQVQFARDQLGLHGETFNSDFSPASAAELSRVLDARRATRIVFVAPELGPPTSLAEHELEQAQSLHALFELVQALLKEKVRGNLELVLLGSPVYPVLPADVPNPASAALFALAKVVAAEYPHVHCRCVDADAATPTETLLREAFAKDAPAALSLRAGKRYLPELDLHEVKPATPLELSRDGVHVITGGAGGLGLELALHLAQKGPLNLALLGRSAPPPRESWAALVTDERLGPAIAKIEQMEQLGSTVRWLQADVSSEASLSRALTELRQEFGRVRGVFHCAGVAGDGFLIQKERRAFDAVVAPKTRGTWLLEHLTRADEPEVFVLFSSLFALVPAPGQGDYAAANAYLDAFAWQRQRSGRRTLALNWPAWRETGMAASRHLGDEGLFRALSNREALQRFDALLASESVQALPAELNFEVLAEAQASGVALPISEELSKRLKAVHVRSSERSPTATLIVPAEVKLLGRSDDEFDEFEQKLGALWASALGVKELDVFDNYHALGGDSLMAQRLIQAIEQVYPGVADITDIFSFPSVSELAAQIRRRSGAAAAPAPKESPSALDTERIEQLLSELDSGRSVDDILTALG